MQTEVSEQATKKIEQLNAPEKPASNESMHKGNGSKLRELCTIQFWQGNLAEAN